ncbi:MAG: hypothetical protein A2219_05490 [Elusimicrobia bacterium RIFOXYA2_FULL_50_26]|nr:MAG: hypothetical protein A2219_05490 [Elusimicrobia bacterium RIFOXYA2_FULL_50_26]OGS24401.1 MAG: hypothetical protein A2314_04195 [Elusimicrobia bacterium RIFOXYB2_FULL_50_12]
MDTNKAWHMETIIAAAAKKLEKNHFKAITARTSAEAVNHALGLITANESVGAGGSQTLIQLELIERLAERGQQLYANKPGLSAEESLKLRRQALNSDIYMASPNAVTLDGKLLFMDSIGNRASGMIFGPKKVIAFAGANKIVENEAAGWARIRQVAGPLNSRRLKLENPCATTGICSDCDSPKRICNIAVTLHKIPRHTQYYVILIAEELGY